MLKTAICTIITKNYLSYARALAKSISAYNPNTQLYVLLADRVDGYFEPDLEPFKIISLEDLPEQETIEKMCFYYTPFELCCGLRGFLHEYIYDQTDIDRWLFLDSDIMVFYSLDKIFEQLSNKSILLTPHCTKCFDYADVHPEEVCTVKSGLYNAGFLGLSRTLETKEFITWFKARLRIYSLNDSSKKLFVDQIWLNLVPFFFQNVALCLEPGANLGHWNIYQRKLAKDCLGNITSDNEPVLFVHFSEWDINNVSKISNYSSAYEADTRSAWQDIAESYRACLMESGYAQTRGYPYSWGYFVDGKPIKTSFRRFYYDSQIENPEINGYPFSQSKYFYRKERKQRGSFLKRAVYKIAQLVP